MHYQSASLRLFATIFGVASTLTLATFTPQSLYGQAAEVKTAGQTFKNVTELAATPADQLVPSMQFIAASLGVDCAFCHVQGKPELDDKGPKKTARSMIAMTLAINKNSFRGQPQVTCYSCHRGSQRPVSMPPALEADAPARPAAPTAPAAGATPATVDQILEKYVTAVGGADAIKKITSRVEKGKLLAEGNETPIDVITQAPNKRISITHNPTAESITAFDGTVGWMGNAGRPAREMSAAESAAAGLDAEFYLPLRLKEIYPQLRRGRPEEIGGVACEVLNGTSAGHPAVRLYFDKNSGLLLRLARYADTPMGRNVTQIDYADYRDADGVKIPFRWTLARSNARFTIQISEVKSNVPVDEARFAKPAAEIK
jgi:photosynthetic reaction center cytochrome c subunit